MNYKEQIKLNLTSAEWIIVETTKLMNEYKKCRTENCKRLIEKKLRAIRCKLRYENKIIENIIEEANNEEPEF